MNILNNVDLPSLHLNNVHLVYKPRRPEMLPQTKGIRELSRSKATRQHRKASPWRVVLSRLYRQLTNRGAKRRK